MGVADLHQLIKTKYPTLVTKLSKRWKDPRVAGKKVAIDGTLVTNAFHMRATKYTVPGLESKNAIIGWYQLVNDMRASGVQPIAIWDQRGTRSWKAAEARRRLTIRQGHLSRHENEVDRAQRLSSFDTLCDDFTKMTEVERNIFHQQWADMLVKNLQDTVAAAESEGEIPTLSPPAGEALPNTPTIQSVRTSFKSSSEPLSEGEAQKSLDKVISFVVSFNEILEDYGHHYRPFSRSKGKVDPETQLATQMAIDHAADLEAMSGESASGGQVSDPDATFQTQDSPIDETLQETAPVVNETKAQTALTQREGELLQSFLITPPDFKDDAPTSEEEGIPRLSEEKRRERLTELVYDAQLQKEKQAKYLMLPTREDHQNCRDLLVRMGVPVLEAVVPYEAEGLASALAKAKLVDFVGTEDSDVLAYEAPLLRGISGGALVTVYGTEVRDALNLDSAAWLDFCILLGTDASSRIPGVGPVNAYNLIEKHRTIEAVLGSDNKRVQALEDKEGFMRDVEIARKVFTDLPPIPEGVVLEDGVWDETALDAWLEKEHGIRFEDELGESLESPGETPKDLVRPEAVVHEVGDDFSWDDVDVRDIEQSR